MNILCIGDIVSEAGLTAVCAELPRLIEKYQSDFIVVNGENIWEGKGPNAQHVERLFSSGATVITTGNHVWENWKSRPLLAKNPKVLRPDNYPSGNEGSGFVVVETKGINVCVLQLQGRVFMPPIDCPFKTADKRLAEAVEKSALVIVDFHAEATAEKVALARYLDGKVSVFFGTHTHVQTADSQIFPQGTAYITDIGMCGPIDSVIGMKTDIAQKRFILQTAHKYESADSPIRISGMAVTIDEETKKALSVEAFSLPDFSRT